jgi:hypothetical protein
VNFPSRVTDASGFFSVTTSVLPDGAYLWRVKGPKFLAFAGAINLAQGINRVEMSTLKGGDATNDNLVSITDFNVMKPTFAHGCGEPIYDARADFTNDCLVSVVDFNLFKNNIGLTGSAPLDPIGRPPAK